MEGITNVYYMQKEVFTEIEALNNPNLYRYYEDLRKKQLENNYSITLTKEMHLSNIDILDIVFFPENSENNTAYMVGINSSSIIPIEYEDYEQEDWFQKAIEKDGKQFLYGNHTPIYRTEERIKEVYSAIRLIKDMDNQSIVGVLKIDARISNLETAINVLEHGSRDIILIKDNDKILASSSPLQSNTLHLTDEKISINSNSYITKEIPIENSSWSIVYLYSLNNLRISTIFALSLAIAIMILAYLLAFTLFRHSSEKTVEDVKKIKEALDEIEKGNLDDIACTVKSNDEIKEISEAVNNTARELKSYIDREYRLVIQQQKAEYKALQSQINPHFLYNTLNGFIALNRMGETEILERSIINLTYMFRYICSKEDTSSIKQEFAFLTEYLELEKMKYLDRLEYQIESDPACEDFILPKLLLQPLVENSIIHGMRNTEEPLHLTIKADKKDDIIAITIKDDGQGFVPGSANVGLSNVQNRALLFFKEAKVDIDSIPGKGTTITITIKEALL